MEKLFEYSAEEVGGRELLKIFARGSSAKEKIDINEQLIIFMLHQGQLFSWRERNETVKAPIAMWLSEAASRVRPNKLLESVCSTDSQEMVVLSANKFAIVGDLYLSKGLNDPGQESKQIKSRSVSQKIYEFNIDFTDYNCKALFEFNKRNREFLINFNVDHEENKLLILTENDYLAGNEKRV